MRAKSINDIMWHWVDIRDGKPRLLTAVGYDIVLSIALPPSLEYEEDVWMWLERIQGAIWGIVGQNGVLGRGVE